MGAIARFLWGCVSISKEESQQREETGRKFSLNNSFAVSSNDQACETRCGMRILRADQHLRTGTPYDDRVTVDTRGVVRGGLVNVTYNGCIMPRMSNWYLSSCILNRLQIHERAIGTVERRNDETSTVKLYEPMESEREVFYGIRETISVSMAIA